VAVRLSCQLENSNPGCRTGFNVADGTTVNGGFYGNATMFEVSASGKKKVLHSFAGSPGGAEPYGGLLVRDAKGTSMV
jgi:hypothetical protein